MRKALWLLVAVLLVMPTAYLSMEASSARQPSVGSAGVVPPGVDDRPNIVFITTDDMRTADLPFLHKTNALLAQHGVTFPQGLSPHPLCCPARAEYLTGEYGQNNGVHHNAGPHGGYHALIDPENTIGRWLWDGGYQTALVGKFLNGYERAPKQEPGWDHWNPLVAGIMTYRHTTFYNDSHPILWNRHVDDVSTDYALNYLDDFMGPGRPFFLWVSYFAPHRAQGAQHWDTQEALPAPKYLGTFDNRTPHFLKKPSFNQADVSDWPSRMRKHKVDPASMADWWRRRLESLQSVDDGVAAIVQKLADAGELDNTWIVFTSDNGYLMGEHRLVHKNFLVSEALRVPYIIRVPGSDQARISHVPITSVDLPVTFADLAGVTPERSVDGTSLVPLLQGRAMRWRNTQLVQAGQKTANDDGWLDRGVMTRRYTYAVYPGTGEEFLTDRKVDPYELRNRATWPEYRPVIKALRARYAELRDCSGADCNRDFPPLPSPLPSR